MPFNRPTPAEIQKRLEAEWNMRFPDHDARVQWSYGAVFVRVITMAVHEIMSYVAWVARQIFIATADDPEILERHADSYGITRKAATPAQGSVTFTGTNGTVIPAGSILRRADALEYTLQEDVTIAAGTGTGLVIARTSSAVTNTSSGVSLALTAPVAGAQSQAIVDVAGLAAGTDAETDDALRERILKRRRNPPHGGAAHDYEGWALEVPGVTRAWVYPKAMGIGTVSVTFVMDDRTAGIIPGEIELAAVSSHLAAARPVTNDVYVFAPEALPVDLEIHLNPNTAAVRNAIQTEVAAFFRREAVPGGTLYISRLREVVSSAVGEFDHVLVTPSANITADFGKLPMVGDYTWEDL